MKNNLSFTYEGIVRVVVVMNKKNENIIQKKLNKKKIAKKKNAKKMKIGRDNRNVYEM